MTATRTRWLSQQDQRRAARHERRILEGRQRRDLVESGIRPTTWQRDPAGTPPVVIIEKRSD